MTWFMDSLRVCWIDLRLIQRNWLSVLVTCLVAPLLYMVAFGYGLGDGVMADGGDYRSFMVPGIVALTTITACFPAVASKVMLQRTLYRSFDELFLCSISHGAIVMGKAYAGVVRGIVSCTVLYAIGMLMAPDIVLSVGAALMILMSCVVYSLLGVVSGLMARSSQALVLFSALVITPMTFLCGTIFPLEALPAPVATAIGALPLTHSTDCIRAAMLGTDIPWVSLIFLMFYGVVFYLIAVYRVGIKE